MHVTHPVLVAEVCVGGGLDEGAVVQTGAGCVVLSAARATVARSLTTRAHANTLTDHVRL